MTTFELSLNGPWMLKPFAECDGEKKGAHKPEFSEDGWITAQVPGTAHLDLLANNYIPDPFKDSNEDKVNWVVENEWWYRKEIDIPQDFANKRNIELIFEGLDTFATVWINGVQIGETNNMFIPWVLDVSKVVNPRMNVIAVRLKPTYKIAKELERKYGNKYGYLHAENFSARPYVRKAQYSFGWDWGPNLPTVGIWRNAKLIAYDKAKLGYLSVLPLQVSEDNAKIKAIADIYASQPCKVEANFAIDGFGQRFEKQVCKRINSGQNNVECKFEIVEPHLWWPRGYGEQSLYDCSVELSSDSVQLDKAKVRCGIRSVKLLQESDDEGKTFGFVVNGLRVFCKGANWIPADSFLPRVSSDCYSTLLNLAVEGNFNMLRVWGGGIYENNLFYDLCDMLGIMVWQDFMYACSAYPEEDWFLKEAEKEADEVVRRLRGHPCIVVWCGNNEIQWQFETLWKDMPRLFGLKIFENVLPKVLSRLDGTRPYRPSTPYDKKINSEHEGNRHNWIVWSKQIDYPAYLNDMGRFLSEFGWQAPSTLSLLKEYLGDKEIKLNSPILQAHEKQTDGLKILSTLLSLHYPVPENFKKFVFYAQLNQADALKTAVTHWRSRMFKTAGCLIWQFNDCWPVISWSLIDYGLNPKAAYYTVKKVFQPIIATIILKEGKIQSHIINETSKDLDLTLDFEILRFSGKVLYSESKKVTIPSYSSLLVLETFLQSLPTTDDSILTVKILENGFILFEDSRTVKEPKHIKLPTPSILLKTRKVDTKTFQITIKSKVYAKAVNLEVDGVKGKFSDNFFDLLPNSPKHIVCRVEEELSLSSFDEKLTWQSYP